MKRTFFFISMLGLTAGCTGNNSSPGFHKTKERPSAAIEPNEKGESAHTVDPSGKKNVPNKQESGKAATK